jgi:hypothetical protein
VLVDVHDRVLLVDSRSFVGLRSSCTILMHIALISAGVHSYNNVLTLASTNAQFPCGNHFILHIYTRRTSRIIKPS